ncbi:MAG: hypothetical protein SGARI_002473 [Bacillariaceae sp.]
MANEASVDHWNDPWNYHLDKVSTEFNGGSNKDPQIVLTYIMNRDRKPLTKNDKQETMSVHVFNHGCGGIEVDDEEVRMKEMRVSKKMDRNIDPYDAYDVVLELDTHNVRMNTDLWTGSEWDFVLKLCVRTIMKKYEDKNWRDISYDETNLNVDVELMSNFNIASIGARADKIQSKDESADVTYKAIACVCDTGEKCLSPPPDHHPNEQLRVCIRSNDDTVEIFDIDEFKLMQDNGMVTTAITDRKRDAVTRVTIREKGNRRMAVVDTPLLKEFFFHKDSPGDLKVEGIAYMAFPAKTRRVLRTAEIEIDVAGKGEFDLSVPFVNAYVAEVDSAVKVMCDFALALVAVTMIFA